MNQAKLIDSIAAKVDAEDSMLAGWYGDIFTPVQVNWDSLTAITQARIVHGHDISTGACRKNRAGYICE